ncbi:hypothetical protein [Pseudoduganella albidiflava]|uniref:Uncharacterized protein n=1 Tax=Pseudoduganella albidiflava TaxID=321983 RepID=A0A411WVZ6_9BURK|nr:hypothetical protein [Pseudoduganella albidiflava]QBI00798.1 hypothetical protein EYF70_08005 [Pseudoduganella albidiflava]GGY30689.1 hypothetical protein GCM10007387_10490 [Pseudoduganella albidiflava]
MLDHFRHDPAGCPAEPLDGLRAPAFAAANLRATQPTAPAAPPSGKPMKRDWLAEALSCDRERKKMSQKAVEQQGSVPGKC